MRSRKCYKNILIIFIAMIVIFISIYLIVIIKKNLYKESTIEFFGIKPFIMRTESIETKSNYGDVVITKNISLENINTGDDFVYIQDEKILAKKVLKKETINGQVNLIIDKENNIGINEENSKIEGKIIKRIPKVGYVLLFMKTKVGIVIEIVLIIYYIAIICIMYFNQKKQNNKMSTEKNK